MIHSSTANTLVTLLRSPGDWEILLNHGIYRIRGHLKHPPAMLTEHRVKYLGFYLPAAFGKHKFSVRHYAKVRKISMAPRYECVPDEIKNTKSNNPYYKIDVEAPQALREPIVSFRGRKYMVLIQTTEEKLFNVPELNFLYQGSRLEEKMWKALIEHNIFAEREYAVPVEDGAYFLDFAVFCNKGNLAIETDGRQHHETRAAVLYDHQRDNRLGNEKWEVYRYSEESLGKKTGETIQQIIKKIKILDGLDTEKGLLPLNPKTNQLSLFSEPDLDFWALRKRVLEKYENNM